MSNLIRSLTSHF